MSACKECGENLNFDEESIGECMNCAARSLAAMPGSQQQVVSCEQQKHMTQKVLKQIASDIANECHKHHGCVASNRQMIYSALRLIVDRTKAANAKIQS